MKKIIIIVSIFTIPFCFSQKVITRSGEIKFEASMPAFEEVAAVNKTVSAILDTSNGDFVALALVKAFKFKVPLMEEHFNENYIESSSFPKATFKGKITNFNISKISATKTTFDMEGDLMIHGVTKKINTKVVLYLTGKKINASSSFSVKPKDYAIEIPSLVKGKIANTVTITYEFTLEPK